MKRSSTLLIVCCLALFFGATGTCFADTATTVGFQYNGKAFKTIEYPGAPYTRGSGINNRGQVVGIYFDSSGTTHSFLYSGGTFTLLDSFDALGTASAYRINDYGQILGNFGSGQNHGLFYSEGVINSIDYPEATNTYALGVNNSGNIVGSYAVSVNGLNRYYGFLDRGGTFSSIDYPGSGYTEADDINNSGEIVGIYDDSSGLAHGYYYYAGVFSSIDFPDALQTFAVGINDLGQIVGYYEDSTGQPRGFLYSAGLFMAFDFHAPTNINWYRDTVPLDINNYGKIVGQVDSFKVKPAK